MVVTVLTVGMALAIVAAVYFAVQVNDLTAEVSDKTMIVNALRAQSERDRLTISELKASIEISKESAKPSPAPRKRAPKKTN
jgi:hypothetical protein